MPLSNRLASFRPNRRLRISPSKRQHQGVVNAVVFHEHTDLTSYLTLQNLLNYFVECINSFTILIEKKTLHAEQLSRCITSIKSFSSTQSNTLSCDIKTQLKEFLDDADDFETLTKALCASHTELRSIRKSTFSQLISKTAHLQWLSVCIMQEMKQTFNPA